MEESNAWRHPVDLIVILENSFEKLPEAVAQSHRARAERGAWAGQEDLIPVLHGDDP